jgi:hypothetical protein
MPEADTVNVQQLNSRVQHCVPARVNVPVGKSVASFLPSETRHPFQIKDLQAISDGHRVQQDQPGAGSADSPVAVRSLESAQKSCAFCAWADELRAPIFCKPPAWLATQKSQKVTNPPICCRTNPLQTGRGLRDDRGPWPLDRARC